MACKEFPRIEDDLPPGCTYSFHGEKRAGVCDPSTCLENNCCQQLQCGRLDAKTASAMPPHLVWVETEEMDKTAAEELLADSIMSDLIDLAIDDAVGNDF
jgi:hypothetical protein